MLSSLLFVFFKKKTSYEIRISYWSSDVCSSDLGMYQRAPPPRIHLSARRPLPRRAYNCAHELGHHVFAHGSSIDELREDAKEPNGRRSGGEGVYQEV